MTRNETLRLSKHMCRLLKVPEVHWTIARTGKGNIALAFNNNNDEFDIFLDSVPLSTKNSLDDENNIELKKMVEKYLFSNEKVEFPIRVPQVKGESLTVSIKKVEESPVPKKRGGRPKGSKNVKKAH